MRKGEIARLLLLFMLVYSLVRAQDFAFNNVQVNSSISGTGSSPAGTLRILTTGTCGTGWTEDTAMNGRVIMGTLAANGNVGTTGGSDTITPAGTLSMNAITSVINHTHAVNITDPGHAHGQQVRSTGTAGTAGTQGGSTANNTTVGTTASSTTGITATTSNPAGGVVSITPTGSFTGTQFDNRPAFVRVIFCVKD